MSYSDSEFDTREKHNIEEHSKSKMESEVLAEKIVEKLQRRTIQNFMDILILTEIQNGSLSGYDAMALMHERFGILMSSGTVYSLLYSLERDGLIKGVNNHRKRVYELTENGKQNIKAITKANQEVQDFLKRLSLLNTA